MRIRSATLMGVGYTLLLTGCGSGIHVRTAVAPNANIAALSTFRILPSPGRPGMQLGPNDPMLANSITNRQLHQDVREALEARGYRLVPRGRPVDFDVATYAAARQALDITTFNYGYTWRGWPRQYTQVTPYKRGTVIIDIVDPGSHQLLWRGQGVSEVSDDPDTYLRQLRKVVRAIIKKVPQAGS